MALRTGHGRGVGSPRVEVLPADELPVGLPAPDQQAGPVVQRDARGRLADSESAREVGRRGGLAKAGTTRLGSGLGLATTFADPRFAPYAKSAKAFRRHEVGRLARTVGGGECGSAPASIIATAALQLAASRFAFEVLGDMTLGSRLGNDSRQNLLAAHELCAREAAARPKKNPTLALLSDIREGGQ